MTLKKIDRNLIYRFILENITKHSHDITSVTASTFQISRQAVNNYLKQLVNGGSLIVEGVTRGIRYTLKEDRHIIAVNVTRDLREDEVWREKIVPIMPQVDKNIFEICNYGFTEMLNNVIDHSESDKAEIIISVTAIGISFIIIDHGVGIFNKMQKAFNLLDSKHAIFELAKGKLTTDPDKHTGEGIFFTSRMFNEFDILSDNLYFHGHKDDDWPIDKETVNKGTAVFMKINKNAKKTMEEVFSEYTSKKDDYGFVKTRIPVKLLRYEGEELISRSQAKRVTTRFDKFKEVILDFDDVKKIGQPFADELFRVFQSEHPDIRIRWVNQNDDIDKMIKHVKSNK